MVPEKLGIFRKLLAKIGKRAFWATSKKMNLWMLSSMAYCVTKKYEEIFEGDTGKAVDTFTEQFVHGSSSIMYELLGTMKIFFSKSLDDTEFLAETALYVILGSKWKKFFGQPRFYKADETKEGVPQLVLQFSRCVLCTGLHHGEIDPKKLRKNSYGELLARALVSLMQLIQDYVGNEYTLEVKETKCQLRGDLHGEGITYYYPKRK